MKEKKKEQITEILQTLFTQKKKHCGKQKITDYGKQEIIAAIKWCRGGDSRTVKHWWEFLWELNFFEQPQRGKYVLNYSRLAELEMPTPLECDPKQVRFVVVKEKEAV